MGFLSKLLKPSLTPHKNFTGGDKKKSGATGTAPIDPTSSQVGGKPGSTSGHVNAGEPSGRSGSLIAAKKAATTAATTAAPRPGATSTPRPRGGMMAGYTGPKPGTPEFKAARARGETPIRTYMKAQRAARAAARPAPASRPAAVSRPPATPRTLPATPRPTGTKPRMIHRPDPRPMAPSTGAKPPRKPIKTRR
jgi:translation initiation factor IF-3